MHLLKVLPLNENIKKPVDPKPLKPKRKLKILLGDLRHTAGGKNIVIMPVGIGYIASYTQALLGPENLDINLFVDPHEILAEIKKTSPNVVALSNYCWNAELSGLVLKIAKELYPNTICISGGPDFPLTSEKRQKYLWDRRYVDFYAYQEGERAFANLIGKIMADLPLDQLKTEQNEGMMSINPLTGELVIGPTYPRMKNLDDIPSPYLGGLMEKWFDGRFAPSLETARGCPFTCTFCEAAASWYTPVSTFSLERMEKELSFIAERIYKYPNIFMSIHDSNFGMYKRDEEVAGIIRGLQDKYNWPNGFDITTGKGNYDRILDIMTVLKNKMVMSTSVQSLHPPTLKIIERRNPPPEKFAAIVAEIKRRGISTVSETILPLPLETKESFFEGFKTLINVGVDQITPYTTMLFKGTELGSDETRQKYQMKTKFRLLPRQYGEYDGYKCFEIEEVCIATNTITLDEYLECRGFSLIATVLSSDQFDVVVKQLKELNVDIYDFDIYVWNLVKSGDTEISNLYFDYLRETREELWDSPEELIDFYSNEENYRKLAVGETGDNKLRKYRTKIFLEQSRAMFELVYAAIREVLGEKADKATLDSLAAAEKWASATRLIRNNINNGLLGESNESTLELPYDVDSWYNDKNPEPLTTYGPAFYKIYTDQKVIAQMIKDSMGLYGDDMEFVVSRLLIYYSIKSLWAKTKIIT